MITYQTSSTSGTHEYCYVTQYDGVWCLQWMPEGYNWVDDRDIKECLPPGEKKCATCVEVLESTLQEALDYKREQVISRAKNGI